MEAQQEEDDLKFRLSISSPDHHFEQGEIVLDFHLDGTAWEQYIQDEAAYTQNELKELWQAVSKNEREEAKTKLFYKRLEFYNKVIKKMNKPD